MSTSAEVEAAQVAREVLAVEAKQKGRRPLVREPIDITVQGKPFRITPCSGKHRAWFLTGYLVVSCGKCGIEKR